MNKFFKLFIFLIIIFLSNNSYAQNGSVTPAANGTVISAAMETVGYYAQAQILDQMKETLGELSGLVYLGVVFSVVMTAALMGSYAPVLWLLVGPPIFVFASGVDIGGTSNRLLTKGPDWKFGAFEDTANFKQKMMLREDKAVNVSYLFHKYNELISEIYQEIISKITSEDVSNQLLFMTRQKVMEDLFAMRINDPKSIELSTFFISQCGKEMNLARQIAASIGGRSAQPKNDIQVLKNQYCELYPIKNKRFRNPSLEDYLTTLTPPHIKGNPVSCSDIWLWLRQSLVKDVAAQTESSLNKSIGQEARITALGYEGVTRKILADFLKKNTTKNPGDNNVEDQCPDASGNIQNSGIVDQGDSFALVANIMSQIAFKKQEVMTRSTTPYQNIKAGGSGGVVKTGGSGDSHVKTQLHGVNSQLRRVKSQEISDARKYESFIFLSAMPYFQGAMLYILSILYPFFAMLLIVPGKASAFLSWMALWAWVKSWDIGWAIVMVTDKILWNIMPHETYYDLSDQATFGPIDIMEMNFSGDTAYASSLYWVIIATLVTSVPVISAEIILGAKRGVAGAILGGANDMATRLSSAAENYTAVQNIGKIFDQRAQAEISDMGSRNNNAAQAGDQVSKGANDTLGTRNEPARLNEGGTAPATAQAPHATGDPDPAAIWGEKNSSRDNK